MPTHSKSDAPAIGFSPNDNQMVQLLVRRGYLDADQLMFARIEQAIEHKPSLLQVLVERGDVQPHDVRTVLHELAQDHAVRHWVREDGLLDDRTLATLERTLGRRTLLQALAESGALDDAAVRQLKRRLMQVRDGSVKPAAIATEEIA